jgi:hypothetical protein
MNEAISAICVLSALVVVWKACRALLKAEKLERNAKPVVVPIFIGTATIILFGLNFIDQMDSNRTPRDVFLGMMLLNFGYAIAICLLLAPHYQKRKNRML